MLQNKIYFRFFFFSFFCFRVFVEISFNGKTNDRKRTKNFQIIRSFVYKANFKLRNKSTNNKKINSIKQMSIEHVNVNSLFKRETEVKNGVITFSLDYFADNSCEFLIEVDVLDFDEEKVVELVEGLEKMRTLSKTLSNILSFTMQYEKEDGLITIRTEKMYPRLLNDYYEENLCTELEFKVAFFDFIMMYRIAKELQLPLSLSMNNCSIVPKKNFSLPFQTMTITPFAFIQGLIDKMSEDDEEEDLSTINETFAQFFEFYKEKIEAIREEKLPIQDILDKMKENDDNYCEMIEKNEYFKTLPEVFEMKSIDLDDLEVIKIYGCGTYGAVMKVKVKSTGKIFALKQSNVVEIPKLKKEAFLMKHLKHEYIVDFEGFTTDKRNFFAMMTNDKAYEKKIEIMKNKNGEDYGYLMMELCEHGDLENFMKTYYKENEYMPLDMLKIVSGQIIELIFHMHRHRICHRDLKPGNILVKSVEPYIQLKLCDFGLSRATDCKMNTKSGSLCTQDPDIICGRPYTDNTELFSLGCILFYVLYKQYAIYGVTSAEEIPEWYEQWKMTFYSKLNGTDYGEIIDFIQDIFDIETRAVKWDTLMNYPFAKECIAVYKWAEMQKKFGKK